MGIRLQLLSIGVLALAACGDGPPASDATGATGTSSGSATAGSGDGSGETTSGGTTSTSSGADSSDGSESSTGGEIVDGWTQIAAGHYTTCGLRGDGTLYCWGRNVDGLLVGSSSESILPAPTRIETRTTPMTLELARSSACFIDTAGAAWCWGTNDAHELGLGDTKPRTEPTKIEPDGWTRIALGTCGCAIRDDANLWCWGWPEPDLTPVPSLVDVSGDWANVVHGWRRAAAIRDNGSLWLWSVGDPPEPFGAVGVWRTGPGSLALSATGFTGCVIADDGSLHCWGLDDFGQLGNGPDGAPPEGDLVEVAEAGPWRWVSTGPAHACAVDAAAALWCWGSNEFGQLGNGSAGTDADPTTADSDVPIEVAGEQQWSSVAVGEAHSCAIDTDHQAWCWGPNASGSLGVGDQDDRSQPTAVVLPDR